MWFAVLEASTVRLATEAFADDRAPIPLKPQTFTGLLGKLVGQLDRLGEVDAATRLRGSLGKLIAISDQRNEVVHGKWFCNYSDNALLIKKSDQAGDSATYGQWTPVALARLVEDIKTGNATVCGVTRTYHGHTRSNMRAKKSEQWD